uniref:Uncharacterized protein n=1 Tax=Meloidogyne javanica TaxID=6303 RepID=A0A915LKW1_MELJA
MLILINLILYIFICSLQSLTKNVYGVEAPPKGFSLKQLEYTHNEDGQTLIINRDKRYSNDGDGDGGGDGAAGKCGCRCRKGTYCVSCIPVDTCIPYARPKTRHHWRRPHNTKRKHYWKPRQKKTCITMNVYGIEDPFNVNDKDKQPLIINLNKRYMVSGIGEGGGDFGGAGAPCPEGQCFYGGTKCVRCRRPKTNRYWNANVYGVEGPPKGFSLKQLEPTYNEDGQMLTVNRNKRYGADGYGDGGGDGTAHGCRRKRGLAYVCPKGFCDDIPGCTCKRCPQRWRRPYIRRKPSWRPPRPRHYIRRRPYWWLRRYLVIEY